MIKKPLGQKKAVSFFENASAKGTLGHAYIIEGEAGSGKRTIASYFAALAVCENKNACGLCTSCKQTETDVNPDITVISADGKASVGVDKIRDIMPSVAYRAIHGGNRVFIIEDADLLTVQAQNALLKVIEDPPKGVIFLLLCKHRSAMLRTIISRTQVLKLMPLPKDALKQIAPSASSFELDYCKGNPGKLIKICADEEFKAFRDNAVGLCGDLFTKGPEQLYATADFFEAHKERKDDLFAIFLYVLRDVIYKKFSLSKYIINSDKITIIDKISENLSPVAAMRAVEALLEAERGMGKYGNYNMAVQNMLIRCTNAKHR